MEQLPVKVILIVLVLLEASLIAYSSYSFQFDDYISVVVIILCLLIAFFAFHYLRTAYREVGTYEAISTATQPTEVDDFTRKELNKLVESPEFKKYQIEKERRARHESEEEEAGLEEGKQSEDTEAVIEEMLELEERIFED